MRIHLLPVTKFMTKKVITTTMEQTLQSACKTMYDNNVGCLVIVKRIMKGLIPIGIITERDIVKIIGSSDFFIAQAPVREFMSTPLITAKSDIVVGDAIKIMNSNQVRRLPIIENDDELVGIISETDILKLIEKK
jgi:CBS domain-containing protein